MVLKCLQFCLVRSAELDDSFDRDFIKIDWMKGPAQRNLDILRLYFPHGWLAWSFRTSCKSFFNALKRRSSKSTVDCFIVSNRHQLTVVCNNASQGTHIDNSEIWMKAKPCSSIDLVGQHETSTL